MSDDSKALVATNNVGAMAAVQREDSEIKSALVMARQFPRQEDEARLGLVKACRRASFADASVYAFPRGGTTVTGPSVDLAREAARLWKNIRYGFRVVFMDDDWCHLMGWAQDLESNVTVSTEHKFRMMVKRGKQMVQADERDSRELLGRHGAMAERNAILKVIPRDLIEDAMAEAAKTKDAAEKKLLQEDPAARIKKMVSLFDAQGITPPMLEAYLKHALSLTTATEISTLTGIYKSIKDGNSRREDHFEVPQAPSSRTVADVVGEVVK